MSLSVDLAMLGVNEDEFLDQVLDRAAAQLLMRYAPSDDRGNEQLGQRIERAVVDEIREQARVAAPGIVAKILEQKVVQSDLYGVRVGEPKAIGEVIADQVKRTLQHPSGSRGDGVLDRLIREEVDRALARELKGALDEAKGIVFAKLTTNVATELRKALSASIPI